MEVGVLDTVGVEEGVAVGVPEVGVGVAVKLEVAECVAVGLFVKAPVEVEVAVKLPVGVRVMVWEEVFVGVKVDVRVDVEVAAVVDVKVGGMGVAVADGGLPPSGLVGLELLLAQARGQIERAANVKKPKNHLIAWIFIVLPFVWKIRTGRVFEHPFFIPGFENNPGPLS